MTLGDLDLDGSDGLVFPCYVICHEHLNRMFFVLYWNKKCVFFFRKIIRLTKSFFGCVKITEYSFEPEENFNKIDKIQERE
jgi:hypothetical protein